MREVISQLQNIGSITVEDPTNPLGIAAISAGVLVPGTLLLADYYRNPRTSHEGIAADAELAQLAIEEAPKDGKFKSSLKRWGDIMLIGAGASIAAISLLNPQLESEKTITGVETMHVIDGSLSMQYTHDMSNGDTRFDATTTALTNAANSIDTDVKTGAVLFGQSTKVASPLTRDRDLFSSSIVSTEIDANGGSLAEAVTLANDVLHGSDNTAGEALFVYSDGTIDDKSRAIDELRTIADQGTEVVIVMPGTPDGSFTLTQFDAAPTPSGVDAAGFAQLDKENDNVKVIAADTMQEIQKIILEQTAKETTQKTVQDTSLFWLSGLAMAVVGASWSALKRWKRNS